MRVALYARVSTKQHGQDVETQLQALRAWAKQRKWKVAGEYADRGWSGAKERRPELDRLMRDSKAKAFDAVAVWKFDRFARSVKHLVTALDDFRSWGVEFVSLSESIDTSTPMGKAMFTILGAIAELERALIKERVQLGVDRARRDGRRLGRPRKRVDEKEIARQVRSGKESIKAIARSWGVARSTVREIAGRNPAKEAAPGVAAGKKVRRRRRQR
jgi:DNA invertase Pin-like site-specific DNA recombinase